MIEFFVEGKPVAKQRPRLGRGCVYTPKQTKDFETEVGFKAKEAMSRKRFTAPTPMSVQVELTFYTKRNSDIDNLAKSILDGMNKIVYEDDRQVQKLICTKIAHRDILEKTLVKVTHV